MTYYDNIYYELKCLNKNSHHRRGPPTKAKEKHHRKLIKYELMALGCFKLAKLFR